jgi:hypothetical protein
VRSKREARPLVLCHGECCCRKEMLEEGKRVGKKRCEKQEGPAGFNCFCGREFGESHIS